MTARLGRVLYWAGILIGTLLAAAGVAINWPDDTYGPAVLTAIVGFGVPFLVGRAARYILAGE
jgi:hypothetical protein